MWFINIIVIPANTNLGGYFCVPCMRRMMLNKNEKGNKAETRIDGKVSGEQDALHFAKCMPW